MNSATLLIGTSTPKKKPQRGARVIASIALRLLYQAFTRCCSRLLVALGNFKTSTRSGPDTSSTINRSQEKSSLSVYPATPDEIAFSRHAPPTLAQVASGIIPIDRVPQGFGEPRREPVRVERRESICLRRIAPENPVALQESYYQVFLNSRGLE